MLDDCCGIAATEFVIIVPMMLVLFFGAVEISSLPAPILHVRLCDGR